VGELFRYGIDLLSCVDHTPNPVELQNMRRDAVVDDRVAVR
jgi:hypothetical protein